MILLHPCHSLEVTILSSETDGQALKLGESVRRAAQSIDDRTKIPHFCCHFYIAKCCNDQRVM